MYGTMRDLRTSFTDESVAGAAVTLREAGGRQAPTRLRAWLARLPAPPRHRRAVTPRPRRTTRLAFVCGDELTRTVSGVATKTNPAVSQR